MSIYSPIVLLNCSSPLLDACQLAYVQPGKKKHLRMDEVVAIALIPEYLDSLSIAFLRTVM